MSPVADGQLEMNVLVVEDTDTAGETLKKTIEEELPNANVQVEADFDRAVEIVSSARSFDAVVLDLYRGAIPLGDNEGARVWRRIWERRLVPIIIYSAGESELDPPIPPDNPFIRTVQKRAGSDQQVAQCLREFQPHILALRQVQEMFNSAINSVIAATSPLIWQIESDEMTRSNLLLRTARRRLAAILDMATLVYDEQLLAWEIYVYPPLGQSLLTGDILQCQNERDQGPGSFRLVLTPSCDMQQRNGACKVTAILVAKCTEPTRYLDGAKLAASTTKRQKIEQNLPRLLSEPHQGGRVLLPAYSQLLPCMAADLRALELIPLEQIDLVGVGDKPYKRIVSIDSPFREQIVWAYIQITGRPGVPDRDFAKWTKEIVAILPAAEENP